MQFPVPSMKCRSGEPIAIQHRTKGVVFEIPIDVFDNITKGPCKTAMSLPPDHIKD